jgi:hypothetical protein
MRNTSVFPKRLLLGLEFEFLFGDVSVAAADPSHLGRPSGAPTAALYVYLLGELLGASAAAGLAFLAAAASSAHRAFSFIGEHTTEAYR